MQAVSEGTACIFTAPVLSRQFAGRRESSGIVSRARAGIRFV